VAAAAHLDQVGIAGEIARAHFRIGLEAARAGDDGLGHEIIAAVRPADPHAFDTAQVAMHGADRRIEPDLDPQPLRDLPPLGELADAAARHMDGDAALEIALVADLGVLLQGLPLDPDLPHPVQRRV
jgi:hypothetical protein